MLSFGLTSKLLNFYINLLMNTFDLVSLGGKPSSEKTLRRTAILGSEEACKGWKWRWYEAGLGWLVGGKRGYKKGPYSFSAEVKFCCLHTASSQILSWQHITSKCSVEKVPLWNLCPCSLPATLPACTQPAAVEPVGSSCHFLGPYCSLESR